MYSELLLAGQQFFFYFLLFLSCALNIQLLSEATFVRDSWPSLGRFDGDRMVGGMTEKERCTGGRRRTMREEEGER
jgi:hypothetical protein